MEKRILHFQQLLDIFRECSNSLTYALFIELEIRKGKCLFGSSQM